MTYIFFVSKAFLNSLGNDNYLGVGQGPLLYNHSAESYQFLGTAQFYTDHYDPAIFGSGADDQEIPPMDMVIESIIARKHINDDDL